MNGDAVTVPVLCALPPGSNLTVTLNPAGRRLLAKKHRLTVKLTITDNGCTVPSQTIAFKTKAKVKHKRRA